MSSRYEVEQFIVNYLRENFVTSATDQQFHEEFYQRFGGKRNEVFYGAQMVYKAQRWLKRLYDDGILRRHKHVDSEPPISGLPYWQYVYSLRKE